MAITATYVTATEFSVSGDRTSYLKKGLPIQFIQGADGTAESAVVSSSYDSGTDTTICTVAEAVITVNLATIKTGATYADTDHSSSNLARHGHTDPFDGGYIPAATMTEDQVQKATITPIPAAGDANRLQRVLPTEDGYTLITVQGTENQVTIDHDADHTTLSLPQDIHSGASPQFAGLTLTALDGILKANGSAPLTSLSAAAAFQVLRRNEGLNGYEFSQPFSVQGVAGEALAEFDAVYLDGEWYRATANGGMIEADARGIVLESGGGAARFCSC